MWRPHSPKSTHFGVALPCRVWSQLWFLLLRGGIAEADLWSVAVINSTGRPANSFLDSPGQGVGNQIARMASPAGGP